MLIELLRGKSDYFHQKLTALVAAGNGINGITNNRIDTSQAFATFANQGNPDEFTVFVETTFDINFNQASKLGDKLCDAVVSSNPTTDTGSVYLRSIIMLYLSAIFYYCGMLIRYSEQISNQNISICIAGNGSKIVNWVRSNLQDALTNMGGGVPGPGGIADVLSGFICSGADINQQNMQFIWSGQPKEEVSCGLVHDVGIAAGGGQAQEVILSGITGIMNDQLVSPNSNLVNLIVNTQDGQEKLTWQQMNGFDEVKAFLNLYNAIPAGFNLKKIQINDHFANVNGQNNVVQILDNTVKTNTQDNTNGRRSPFIVAIQQISREILAQWH